MVRLSIKVLRGRVLANHDRITPEFHQSASGDSARRVPVETEKVLRLDRTNGVARSYLETDHQLLEWNTLEYNLLL